VSLRLSQRVQRVSLSANAAAKSRVTELREQGRDILDLTTGEPDFDTPEHVKQAAYAAIQGGATKYTATPGVKALRLAIQDKLRDENHLDYALAQIVVGNGAKGIIFNAFAATLDDGDEVLVPAPYWPTFPDSVRFNGGRAVLLECPLDQGCKLIPEQLEAAIGERTRWLVLNSPSNPSGAIYSADELRALAAVLRRHTEVWVLLDELYEHIRFDANPPLNLLNVAPDLADRCLLVGGVSKTYAMTGWRIGFGAGPQALVQAMTVVQSQSASGASSVGQAAALAAFQGGLEFLHPQVKAYRERRDLLGRRTRQGQRLVVDTDVVDWLLEEGVAVVAGSAYGLSPWFRLSIATATSSVAEAGRRIAEACAGLSEVEA
jgi:aspartate aminotransferase